MAEKKSTTTSIDYVTLSAADRLVTARDHLRGRETDHYRLWLSSPEVEPTRDSRLPQLEAEIERLQGEVKALEAEVNA